MKKGWQTKKLADLVEVQNGYAFSSKDYSESGHFLMRIGNVQNGYISTADPKFIKLPADGSLQRFVLSEDDILVSLTGNVGRVGVIQESHLPAALNQRVARISIRKDSPATRELLLLFLCSDWFREELIGAGHGAAQQNVSTKDLVEIEIPVPPLAEQQRIVGLLDEAFEGIATAKANAEKNLQNARALFESHLQSVFTQRGPGWVEKKLEDIADSDCSLSYGIVQPGEEFDEGMPIVRPTDLTTKVIRLGGLKRIDPKLAGGYKRTALQGGELLLCVRGSTGVVSIASPELAGANVTRGIVPIRFNRSLLLPEFGFYLISGGPVQSQIREKTYGTALMQINIRDLRLISLSIPPLTEQKAIAAKLDSLHEETQRLARLYEQKLALLTALKKSLLHQAFTGEL